MNILGTQNKPIQYSPKFKAIPLAQYSQANRKCINIYQLEKKDLPFITNFLDNIKQFFADKQINDLSKQEILTNSLDTAKKILSNDRQEKTRILVAVNNGELSGVLVGNVPKKDKHNKIHYSSRKNHSKHETELDWLVALNGKGVGKSLVSEYFRTAKQDRFRKVFVRSEVPEETFAQSFYEKMGFVQLPDEREKIVKDTSNKYCTGEYYFGDEEVIPMIARYGKINKTINNVSEQMNRVSLSNVSINIERVIK